MKAEIRPGYGQAQAQRNPGSMRTQTQQVHGVSGQMLGARHEHESERNTVPSPAPSCLALGCKHSENKFRFPGNIYLGPCGERVRWSPCVLP